MNQTATEIIVQNKTDYIPKISVIIPVYNVEKYLRECLDSVVNQTFTDIEIICVNDGSIDASLNILKEYADKDDRITVMSYVDNKGGGYARNQALKIARGEYLSFLDSDDFYNKDFCQKMYDRAKEHDCDIVICRANKFDTLNKKINLMPWSIRIDYLPKKDVFSFRDMPDYIFNFSQNWNWNKFFRRALIEENGIDFQEIHRTNDLLFTCKALISAKRISVIKEPLVNYRVNMQTNCQSTNYKYPLDFYYAFAALKKWLDENGLYNSVKNSYINWLIEGCVYNIYSITNHKKEQQTIINMVFKSGLSELDLASYKDIVPLNIERYKKIKKLYLKYRIRKIVKIFWKKA